MQKEPDEMDFKLAQIYISICLSTLYVKLLEWIIKLFYKNNIFNFANLI